MAKVLDSHFLAITAIITVCYQFVFFVVTALLKFDKVTDFAGSTNFIILAVLTIVIKASWNFRQVILTLLVVIWGLRLGLFLLMRPGFLCLFVHFVAFVFSVFPMLVVLVQPDPSKFRLHLTIALILQWGEDHRFDEMRANLGKLAVFWIFQAVWVWTVSLPVTIVNASDKDPSIGAADIIGASVPHAAATFLSVDYHCLRLQQIRNLAVWMNTDNTRELLAHLSLCHQQYMEICLCGSRRFSSLNFPYTARVFLKKDIWIVIIEEVKLHKINDILNEEIVFETDIASLHQVIYSIPKKRKVGSGNRGMASNNEHSY
uniref:Uncharacterized protein n=1 Tax=Chenopodium quinoa TaxID=63459 RepID=A0A803LLJ5_CHEQI